MVFHPRHSSYHPDSKQLQVHVTASRLAWTCCWRTGASCDHLLFVDHKTWSVLYANSFEDNLMYKSVCESLCLTFWTKILPDHDRILGMWSPSGWHYHKIQTMNQSVWDARTVNFTSWSSNECFLRRLPTTKPRIFFVNYHRCVWRRGSWLRLAYFSSPLGGWPLVSSVQASIPSDRVLSDRDWHIEGCCNPLWIQFLDLEFYSRLAKQAMSWNCCCCWP